jgi:copper transporter 1
MVASNTLIPYYAVVVSVVLLYFVFGLARPSHQQVQHLSQHPGMDHNNMDHSGHQMANGDMPMMPMWFQWSMDTYLWLQSIHTTGMLPYLGTLLLLVAFSMAHEALASYRVSFSKAHSQQQPEGGYLPMAAERGRDQRQHHRARLINSGLYAANMATSFLLMLAVMTYNAGFFFAVVLGLGLGHFFCFKQIWHHRVDTCCETAVGPVDF